MSPLEGPAGFGGGGGTGVLGLGPTQNTFGDDTTADRAAAETLRETYENANAAWLASYNGNRSFWIRLQWDDGTVEQRRNVRGDDWEDVTNVVRGRTGDQGAQGEFRATIYRNSSAALDTAPTGGSYEVDTQALTAPIDWTTTAAQPAAGETIYESYASIDPSAGGTITPTWSVPIAQGQGAQGAFRIRQYINADTAPAIPTGGSYNVDTAVLTPSTDWAASPTEPARMEMTYVSEALIDPERQSGDVTPTWLLPFEHGGDLVSHTVANPAGDPTAQLRALDINGVVYDVEEVVVPALATGVLRDPVAEDWDTTNGRSRVMGFTGAELVTVSRRLVGAHGASATFNEIADGTTIPGRVWRWRGFHHNDNLVSNPQQWDFYRQIGRNRFRGYRTITGWENESSGNVLGNAYVGAFDFEADALGHISADNQYVLVGTGLFSISDFVAADAGNYEYKWVPYDPGFTPGVGTGGGVTLAQVRAEIAGTDITTLQGQLADSQIPAAIFRDAEFTEAAVRTLLGLTQAQTDAFLTGTPTISGDTITFARHDGMTVTLSLASFLSETEFNAQRGNRLFLSNPTPFDATAFTLTLNLTPALIPIVGDHVLFIAPTTLDDSDDAITVLHNGTPDFPLHNDDGHAVSASHLEGGRVYSLVRLNSSWRILEPLEADPIQGIALAIGWSDDTTAEVGELTATAMDHEVTIPANADNDYLVLWHADSQGTLSAVYVGSSTISELNVYGAPEALELMGVAGQVRVSVNRRVASLLGGEVVRVEFI